MFTNLVQFLFEKLYSCLVTGYPVYADKVQPPVFYSFCTQLYHKWHVFILMRRSTFMKRQAKITRSWIRVILWELEGLCNTSSTVSLPLVFLA